jgi:Mlc titration factor MtfA (ptsG expression regulator)
MEIVTAVLTLLLSIFILYILLFLIFNYLIEPVYMMAFNRPIYVHFYPVSRQLEPSHIFILENEFRFYRKLSEKRKHYFRHRVSVFIKHYEFAGRDGLIVTEEMKVKIAATAVMLTFGMRSFLSKLFSVIILYPDAFLSANGEDYHKGEFNPRVGAVVFSWKHFSEGLQYDNDNLNLGLHEFAHVLHIDSTKLRRPGSSAVIYDDMFARLMGYLQQPLNRKKLVDAGYFREYAYTNQYEFIAVILEHFFETPAEFRQRFPELYSIVARMINYREG